MSGIEPEVWMVQWSRDGEIWVDAHADEPRAVDQARAQGGECIPMVRADVAAEMLEALKMVQRGMLQWSISPQAPEWNAIGKAIAKATGGS